MVVGGLLLFDVEGLDVRIDIAPLVAVGVLTVLAAVAVGWLVARAHTHRVETGKEGLVGLPGEVSRGGEGGGWVVVHGEDWRATWEGSLERGASVRVLAVDGLKLRVEPAEAGPARNT